MTEAQTTVDRHASWLELFFDLVVVVAVSQLAHLLHGVGHHGPDGLSITRFFALYLAIWLVWTTFTLYSNVVAERVRARSMFLGMAGIATMAAAVPQLDERANLFAAFYIVTSAIGGTSFTRSGRIMLSWTAASQNVGMLPWIVSFWVESPWWKLSLWLFGLAMALWVSVFSERADQDAVLARINQRLARRVPRPLVAAEVDAGHLGERLGLFVIIVLGEAMLQLVGAVGEVDSWGWLLLLTVAAAFGLLVSLWALNVRFGFAEETRFPPSLVLPAHFVAVAAITTVAVGLGVAAEQATEHLPTPTGWLLCSGVAAFLLVVNLLVGSARWWALRGAGVVLPLVVGVVAGLLPAAAVVAVLFAVVAGQVFLLRWQRIRSNA